jgi:hypothetical protein
LIFLNKSIFPGKWEYNKELNQLYNLVIFNQLLWLFKVSLLTENILLEKGWYIFFEILFIERKFLFHILLDNITGSLINFLYPHYVLKLILVLYIHLYSYLSIYIDIYIYIYIYHWTQINAQNHLIHFGVT